MKYYFRLLFILLPFLMIGCPLESEYPLGDSRYAPMDHSYIGRWVVTELGLSGKETMLVLPFNENEYYVETRVIGGDKVARFRAYLTVIDNVQILNIQDIDENISKRRYSFLKISLETNGVLTLWVVNNNLLGKKHPSNDELFRYIQEHLRNDDVYNKLTSFKRQVQ